MGMEGPGKSAPQEKSNKLGKLARIAAFGAALVGSNAQAEEVKNVDLSRPAITSVETSRPVLQNVPLERPPIYNIELQRPSLKEIEVKGPEIKNIDPKVEVKEVGAPKR